MKSEKSESILPSKKLRPFKPVCNAPIGNPVLYAAIRRRQKGRSTHHYSDKPMCSDTCFRWTLSIIAIVIMILTFSGAFKGSSTLAPTLVPTLSPTEGV